MGNAEHGSRTSWTMRTLRRFDVDELHAHVDGDPEGGQ
eukprot:gene8999-27004_t